MKQPFTAWLLTVVFASFADAEFSPTEKQQVVNQIEAMGAVARAATKVTAHLGIDQSNVALAVDFVQAAIRARETHFEGMLRILDVTGDLSLPRPALVVSGFERIATAGPMYQKARRLLEQLQSGCAGNCDSLSVALRNMDQAISMHGSFDSTLSYLQPWTVENMSAPGFSRTVSPMIHPHGDYRQFGRSLRFAEMANRAAWEASVEVLRHRPQEATREVYWKGHFSEASLRLGWALELMVGAESPEIKRHVDQMEAGGTTRRGRHFFRVLLIDELLLNSDDSPPLAIDVNGRRMIRGLSYSLGQLCKSQAEIIRDDKSLPSYVKPTAQFFMNMCDEWRFMDNLGHNTLTFRYFTVIGPPPLKDPPTCQEPSPHGQDPAEQVCK